MSSLDGKLITLENTTRRNVNTRRCLDSEPDMQKYNCLLLNIKVQQVSAVFLHGAGFPFHRLRFTVLFYILFTFVLRNIPCVSFPQYLDITTTFHGSFDVMLTYYYVSFSRNVNLTMTVMKQNSSVIKARNLWYLWNPKFHHHIHKSSPIILFINPMYLIQFLARYFLKLILHLLC